jgi:acetyl esterase/lipase
MKRSVTTRCRTWLALVAPIVLMSGAGVAFAQEQPVRYRDPVFERVERTNDIVYGRAIDVPTGRQVELKLDMYEPMGDTAASRPVLVFAHGGGFVGGDKSAGQRWAMEFARRGWVVASISYRLAQGDLPTVGIPAAVSDARQALSYLWNTSPRYRLDMGRVVVSGSSAGAITMLFVAYTDLEKGPDDANTVVAGVMDLWGGMYGQEREMTADEPPLIIVHGTNDTVVPYAMAEALRDRADAVGIPYAFHPLQGVGHGSSETALISAWTAEFFYPLLWPNVGLPTDTPRATSPTEPTATPTGAPSTGTPTAEPVTATVTEHAPTAPPPTPTAGSPSWWAFLPYALPGG